MAALRETDLADFLKRRRETSNGLLFFGNDEPAVASAVRQVVVAMPDGEEPLRLDASALRADPAALDDAFRSMSLLGDRRLIVVTGVDENHVALLESVLAAQSLGNFVVLVADSLKKGSKLRAAAEASPLFAAIGFYAETGGALVLRVQTILRHHGMAFADGAAERFVDLAGSDRSVLEGEAEKLSLYCHPNTSVSVEDVEASCGDQAAFEADALMCAVLDGDLEMTDRIFTSMMQSGDAKSALILAQLYLARLENISAAMARGTDLDSANKNGKPPFFGVQFAAAGRALRVLSGDDLGRMQTAVQAAILQSRQVAELGDAITGRCLLSLARMVRQSRVRSS
jgi:DNA polymerase III subunit delta